jgi:hypothetical protein
VTEDILGLEGTVQTGDVVKVLVDPSDPRTVYPVVDVRDGYKTGWLTSLTAVALLCLGLLLLLILRQVVVVRATRRASDEQVIR